MSKDFENIKNNEINKEVDKKKLLEKLALDISNKFWIDKQKTESFIKKETLSSLDSFKLELSKETNKETNQNINIEELFFSLKWALETTENLSKLKIEALKNDIENDNKNIESNSFVEKFANQKLLERVKNPKNLWDNIIWAGLWTINSIHATADIMYQIWKWILLSPYHIYMILSSKAKTDSFKNI